MFVCLITPDWLGAFSSIDFPRAQETMRARHGQQALQRLHQWNDMIIVLHNQETAVQLARVNQFFNRHIRFDDDIAIWGEQDFWATPLETLGIGAGDCEDFTIAKYISLRLAGIPDERMRLIYVRARIGDARTGMDQAHMVLGYYATPNAEPLILDNLIDEIRPASRRPDLFPVFSFNSEGLWVGGAHNSSADPTARLSRWRPLFERMRAEGLR